MNFNYDYEVDLIQFSIDLKNKLKSTKTTQSELARAIKASNQVTFSATHGEVKKLQTFLTICARMELKPFRYIHIIENTEEWSHWSI